MIPFSKTWVSYIYDQIIVPTAKSHSHVDRKEKEWQIPVSLRPINVFKYNIPPFPLSQVMVRNFPFKNSANLAVLKPTWLVNLIWWLHKQYKHRSSNWQFYKCKCFAHYKFSGKCTPRNLCNRLEEGTHC